MNLLTEGNSKALKSRKYGFLSATLELAPGKLSGVEMCPNRGVCYASCVFNVGFGSMPTVWNKRIERTKLFNKQQATFVDQLLDDIAHLAAKSRRLGLLPAVRLNTFSDVSWELIAPEIFSSFRAMQFYDYTKNWIRMKAWIEGRFPSNYHLTWSASERDHLDPEGSNGAIEYLGASRRRALVLHHRGNVAAVVERGWCKGMTAKATRRIAGGALDEVCTYRCVDGDKHDLTFMHPPSSVLVLSPKGKAKHLDPKSMGFVLPNHFDDDVIHL